MNLQHILNEHSKWLNGEGGERANLQHTNLSDADLSDADLSDANLNDADLRRTNLRDTYLHGTNLRGVDLRGVDLQHANLNDADLHSADLHSANLRDANLRGANLRDADLSNADLRDANLWGTIGNMREVKSLYLERYPITYTTSHLQIGCKNYPIEQWWEFSESEIFKMDGQKAVDFWHKYKDLIKEVIKTSPAVDTLVK